MEPTSKEQQLEFMLEYNDFIDAGGIASAQDVIAKFRAAYWYEELDRLAQESQDSYLVTNEGLG